MRGSIPYEALVNDQAESQERGYDDFYKDFDSPFMQQLRLEAYGTDIGQHSWVDAEDMERESFVPVFVGGAE